MDDAGMPRKVVGFALFLARLQAQLGLLVALAGLIAAFVIFGGLRGDIALIGFVLFVGLVGIVPTPIAAERADAAQSLGPERARLQPEQTIAATAEALPPNTVSRWLMLGAKGAVSTTRWGDASTTATAIALDKGMCSCR